MIFPLGLGHSILKLPVVTLLLILANFYCYFYFQNQVDIQSEVGKAYKDSKYIDEYVTAFIDYCQLTTDNQSCELYGKTEVQDTYDKNFITDPKTEKKEKSKIPTQDILKLSGTLIKFHTVLTKTPDELANIKNYSTLIEAQTRRLEILDNIYYEYDFLSRNNFSPLTVMKAQFNHFDLIHLMGNMIFLLVFGIYVEHRISSASYLGFYLLGGTMGLLMQTYVFNPEHFLLGASANVYAVVGMFYALFFDKKMKFFIWYFFSRKVTVDVKYWMPALVFANEIVLSARDATFSDGVAHLAHVGGLVTGIMSGYFLREFSPLNKNFLYQFEVEEWRSAKKSGNSALISETAVNILSFNPFNDIVAEDYMNTLVDEFVKKPTAIDHMKITRHFPVYFRFCINEKKYDELISALERIQPHCNVEPLLRYRPLAELIEMGDLCVEKNKYLVAITCYAAFIHTYPNSQLTLDIQKSIKNILEHLEQSELNASVIKALASNSHNVFLKKLLFDSIQERAIKEAS